MQRPWMFKGGLLLVLGLLFFTASKINFNEDISKLIPATDKNKTVQQVLDHVNFSDKLIVQISKKAHGTTDDLVALASQFLDSLYPYQKEYVENVQGQIPDDEILETLDFVYGNLPLFLTEEEYKTIDRKLAKDSIDAIVAKNYAVLVSPTGLIAKKTIVRDPLGISVSAAQKLKKIGVQENFILRDGFLMSADKAHVLLFITPKFNTSNTKKNEDFVQILTTLQEQLGVAKINKASIQYYGGVLIAVANAKQIKRDIQFTVGISLSTLLLFLVFFYKRVTIPIVLLLPTLFGGLLGLAVLQLLREDISAISLGVGAILLGVTLDYSLHILTHIRNHGNTPAMFKALTKPILMSSITTAFAFLCLLLVDSEALTDLGIFAAVSVLGASIGALVIIPQLYRPRESAKTTHTLLDRIAQRSFHTHRGLIIALIAALVVSVFTFQNVGFDKDLSQLNYMPAALKNTERSLDSLTNVSSKSLYVVAYGNNLQDALEQYERTFLKLEQLQGQGLLVGYNTVATLGISFKSQQAAIARWEDFWIKDKKDTLINRLVSSGKELGMKPKAFLKFQEQLYRSFDPIQISEFEALNAIPISEFVNETENMATATAVIKIKDENRSAIETALAAEENTVLLDRQAINEALLATLKDDFNKLIYYCSGAVALLLLVFYRDVKTTLVTLLPILLTWWLTLGVMGMLGLQFNVLNIIVSSFVFGLGVDYCIFMTNGLMDGKATRLPTYKTAILLSVLTTLLGMGALIFAEHPALYSISVVSMIGITSAVLISFTIQPILYRLLIFKGNLKNEAS